MPSTHSTHPPHSARPPPPSLAKISSSSNALASPLQPHNSRCTLPPTQKPSWSPSSLNLISQRGRVHRRSLRKHVLILPLCLSQVPLDVNFNIYPVGSRHSFLWETSHPINQSYCDRMKADFGGAEIFPAIKSTIERWLKDLNLEIMVLTDGEVWDGDLFKYVEKETEKGDEFGY